jgi:hypothetical protein
MKTYQYAGLLAASLIPLLLFILSWNQYVSKDEVTRGKTSHQVESSFSTPNFIKASASSLQTKEPAFIR